MIPWRRVLVEGVVIVGSILLAFTIDAWWEGRLERERESFYLVELERELQAVRGEIRPYVRLADVTRTRLGTVREDLEAGKDVSSDTLASTLRLAVTNMTFAPLTAVYDDLVATGGLRLLRDDRLRFELARYQAQLNYFREKVTDAESNRTKEWIPFLNRELAVYDLYEDAEHRSSRFTHALERLRRDPQLSREMALRMMVLEAVSLHGERVLGQLEELLKMVQEVTPDTILSAPTDPETER